VLLILKKLLAKADRDERGTETLLRSVSLLTTRPAEYLMIEGCLHGYEGLALAVAGQREQRRY